MRAFASSIVASFAITLEGACFVQTPLCTKVVVAGASHVPVVTLLMTGPG